MTEMTFRSDIRVDLKDWMGGDEAVIQAMLVSSEDADVVEAMLEEKTTFGRINFLMKNRHGTPFEHASLKFYVEAPIFVFREWHRHRIGWSYNEMSGRYRELPPTFYVPARERPLVQQGKPGAYEFVPGTFSQHAKAEAEMRVMYQLAYDSYGTLLADGIAKEVARVVLPVGTYSAMFATCNPRSLMAFLSLRTRREGSLFPSFPQREIEMAAEQMEFGLQQRFPLTYRAFVENGRVAP